MLSSGREQSARSTGAVDANPAHRVSAVIVNTNDRENLLCCVRSLEAEGLADVVVADNQSVDGSREALAAAHREVTTFVPVGGNFGYGTAANRGASHAAGEFLLVCNTDLTVEPGAVGALVAIMDRNPGTGLVGPRIENPDGSTYPSPRRYPRLGEALGHAFLGLFTPRNRFTRRYCMLDWDRAQSTVVDWVSGACFLVRRQAWEAVGGFDESFFLYAEDVDLCWRLNQAGWQIAFEPAARVVHVGGATTEKLAPYRMILEHHRSALRFSRRYLHGWERAFFPLAAAGLGFRAALACSQRAVRAMRARA